MVVEFPIGSTGLKVHAVSDVSVDIREGETLGLVGESGCGKTTTGRAMMQVPPPTSGNEDIRDVRSKMQMIFQDPTSSLNPRRTIREIVAEPLVIQWLESLGRSKVSVRDVLSTVGLDPDVAMDKRPHEFSGGQAQRICIARALTLDPKILICDEPVSALDVSVQAQILNLLESMKKTYGLTMVFISHDLAVVKNISDRVAVMYLGKICEIARPDELYFNPAHPYSAALISSIPVPDPLIDQSLIEAVEGELPSPIAPPSGCRFRTRCPRATEKCTDEEPQIRQVGEEHFVACHFPLVDAEPIAATSDGEMASA
ncbi:UNVERIFIED_CONTAM: hypothetical protein GTU68_058118 [Idotea baltica]|nr:hypothetical protein [Idotea baltica]